MTRSLPIVRRFAKVALLAAVIAWFFGVSPSRLAAALSGGDASRAVAGVHHVGVSAR